MEPHPAPPANLDREKLPLTKRSIAWHRIFNTSNDPIFFGRICKYRWDAPDGSFGVLYAAAKVEGAFVETCCWNTDSKDLSEAFVFARGVAILKPSRPLSLVDLTGKGKARLGVDGRLTSGDEYDLCRQWAKAFYNHPSRPDGILCRARHDQEQLCVAIFERSKLTFKEKGRILFADDHALLGRLLDRYDRALVPGVAP